MRKGYYTVKTSFGMAIRRGPPAAIKRAIGYEHVHSIRPSTKEDVIYVTSMGGWVPEEIRLKETDRGE